jgi:putative transposase
VKYAAIAGWADSGHPGDDFPVTFMCDQLGVSRSGYYDWRRRLPCRRELDNTELAAKITEHYEQLPGRPGVRRVWEEFTAYGWRVSRKRVWRLMRETGLQGRTPRRWRPTTIAGRRPIDAPDLLGQDFDVEQLDTAWAGDITYIATVDGFCFLATVIDLASRKVVGWALDRHLRTDLVTDALTQALATRRPETGVIFTRIVEHNIRLLARSCRPRWWRSSIRWPTSSCRSTSGLIYGYGFW